MKLKKALNESVVAYQNIPFWSWNDKLEEEELKRQIKWMKSAGMGGFFTHARSGLETEYLGEDWFAAVQTCVETAKTVDMDVWCYDENGWPSGFAGMKLLEAEENWAHYITFEKKGSFDGAALAVYVLRENKLVRVFGDIHGAEHLTLYDRTNSSVVDIMNPAVVDKFIVETHEKYYERFGDEFGKTIVGFFTDEPQYFRWDTAYTPYMLGEYAKLYHEDLLDTLAALFLDCDDAYKTRYRYWKLLNRLITESFFKKIYDWCEAHGCKLTGHGVEESFLSGQMWCCAGVMPLYEYLHIPGMDWLGRGISTELAPRQLSSAAMQIGKKQILTETFACTGWDVTPRELKRIGEWQYVNGVNLMCTHLTPYSIRGNRKNDYPQFFSEHIPWGEDLKILNDYFTALGYMLAESTEIADVAIIHPMHTAYLTYNRALDHRSVSEVNDSFFALIEKMGAANIGHHYIDESMLERLGSVAGDKLKMGLCAYRYIIIPDMAGIDSTTVALMKDYLENGGRLYLAGKKPSYIDGVFAKAGELDFLESNITFEEMVNPDVAVSDQNTEIRSTYRRAEFGDFIFAVNLSETVDYHVSYRISQAAGKSVKRFNLLTREYQSLNYEVAENGINLPLSLRAGESAVIMLYPDVDSEKAAFEGGESLSRAEKAERLSLTGLKGKITAMTENILPLDYAAISYDGVIFEDTYFPVPGIAARLLSERENRTLYLKYKFEVSELLGAISLEVEPMNITAITVNGSRLVQASVRGKLDHSFSQFNIEDYVKIGTNEVVLAIDYHQSPHVYHTLFERADVTEALINCLTYETEIAAVYLVGDFSVTPTEGFFAFGDGVSGAKGDFEIRKAPHEIDLAEINRQGFAFFAGKLTLETRFDLESITQHNSKMTFNGRYAVLDVTVNGRKADKLFFDDTCHLEGHLHEGENVVEMTLTTNNRNLFGPHHLKSAPEPMGVGPDSFEMKNTWKNGESEEYRHDYSFVDYGIHEIEIF